MMQEISHMFVICAFQESPYLEECIQSLLRQTIQGRILIVTSTPNQYIDEIASKWKIPVRINRGKGGITQDWNFAYQQANTQYVTLIHQDDVYEDNYLERALYFLENSKRPLIYFTNYGEIREGERVVQNLILKIKRIMLRPLQIKKLQKSKWIRRRILSFGSPICCPSVTYVKRNLPEKIFRDKYRSCEDWEAWEMVSRLKGEFIYNKEIMMYHRIHKDSETTAIIGENRRSKEEFEMYCKFWPTWIAKILIKQYEKSQKSNELD